MKIRRRVSLILCLLCCLPNQHSVTHSVSHRIIIRFDPSQTNGPRLSASERRERILQAGTEVFAERGYSASSVSNIAARAGVVASVLYDHFGSKRELHIELLELHGEALIERSINEIRGDGPYELLRASIDAFYRFVEEDSFVWRFLFRDPPSDPEIAVAHRRVQERATEGIAGLVSASIPGAESVLDAPTERAAWMLAKASQEATQGLAEWWWEHPEVPREEVVELLLALLWEGFGGLVEMLGGQSAEEGSPKERGPASLRFPASRAGPSTGPPTQPAGRRRA